MEPFSSKLPERLDSSNQSSKLQLSLTLKEFIVRVFDGDLSETKDEALRRY
jgi:hypothetical protein